MCGGVGFLMTGEDGRVQHDGDVGRPGSCVRPSRIVLMRAKRAGRLGFYRRVDTE